MPPDDLVAVPDDLQPVPDDLQPVADEPGAPVDLMADQGPPSDGVPASAMRPMTQADAQWEGLNDMMPFARDLDAAALGGAPQAVSEFSTAMAGGSPSWQRVLEAYRERKAAGVARGEQAREQRIGDYLKTNVAGSLGLGAVTAGAGAYAPAADLAALVGQGENFGDAQPGDVAVPLVAGKVVGLAGRAGIGLVKGIAAALGVPLTVAEELFGRFGATRLGKMIAGNDPTPEGRVISDRAKSLKAKINAPGEFQPAPGPKIEIGTPENGRAYDLAQQVEAGRAQLGPGAGDFVGPPSLEGDMYDESLRAAMQKNVPDFDPSADLLGEVENLKYPPAGAAGSHGEVNMSGFGETKNVLAPKSGGWKADPNQDLSVRERTGVFRSVDDAGNEVHGRVLEDGRVEIPMPEDGPVTFKSLDEFLSTTGNKLTSGPAPRRDPVTKKVVKPSAPVAENVPSGAGRLKSNNDAWQQIVQASGVDDTAVDMGNTGAGGFDEIEQMIGRRVRSAKDAFDGLVKISAKKRGRTQQPYDWEDVQTAVRELRKVEGLEGLQLPAGVQERLVPQAAGPGSASFNVAKMDAENAADAAKQARELPRDWWPNENAGKDPRRHLLWKAVETPEEKEAVWEAFADDSMGLGEANARWRLGEDSRVRPGQAEVNPPGPPPGVEGGPSPVERAQRWNDVKRDTAEGMQSRREALVSKAQEYRKLIQQAKAIESQNRMESERLMGMADKAREEFENIARGRRAAEKVAGAVAGWKAGSAGGIMGKVGAAGAGYKIGVPVGLGAESSAIAGQKLAAWAAANADKWATRGDELGRMAQWALSGGGAARMLVLGRAANEMGEAQ